MTAARSPRYDRLVDVLRFSASRWLAAGLGSIALWCAAPLAAQAATSSFDVGDQAWVQIAVRGKGNAVAVKTWDRPTVQIESGDDAPAVERRSVTTGTPQLPLSAQIPPFPWNQQRDGQAGQGMYPPEDFPLAPLRPGAHDFVRVTAGEGARLTVTVPASTGVLRVQVGGGLTTVDGYRGANLFVIQNTGRVRLNGIATTAFAQMSHGTLYAGESGFDRIRVRAIDTHVVFEHCRSKQIEASTVGGSIVYDGGTFDPGLARFESQTGNIALGAAGAAQLSGRSGDGHVYTSVEHRATADQHGDGEASLTVGSNGPLVNAISAHGNVFLYDGTLASRRTVAPEWRPVNQLFTSHRRPPPPARASAFAPPRRLR